MSGFKTGDSVRAKSSIYAEADDYAPGGYLCVKGDALFIRSVEGWGPFDYGVSHTLDSKATFMVKSEEIEAQSLASGAAG